MNGHDCTNNTRRNPSDCQVYTSVQALMAESVTKRLEPVHNNHWPVAGNGRLIAGHRSISDRSYRMVSFGYVSPDLATSGLYWSTTCKFMVMFLQFAQRQKHCCLCWHQSLISCRCGCGSRSQLDLSPSRPGGSNPPLLWQRECHRCYFIHVIDRDLLNVLHLGNIYWWSLLSGTLNTVHADMIWLSAWGQQIIGLLFRTIELISGTRLPCST